MFIDVTSVTDVKKQKKKKIGPNTGIQKIFSIFTLSHFEWLSKEVMKILEVAIWLSVQERVIRSSDNISKWQGDDGNNFTCSVKDERFTGNWRESRSADDNKKFIPWLSFSR